MDGLETGVGLACRPRSEHSSQVDGFHDGTVALSAPVAQEMLIVARLGFLPFLGVRAHVNVVARTTFDEADWCLLLGRDEFFFPVWALARGGESVRDWALTDV